MMRSPFPGMDPYLETHWRDVLSSLVIYTRDSLQRNLPRDLVARTEERVYIEADLVELRQIYPDVRVIENTNLPVTAPPADGDLAVAEPILFQMTDEPATEGFIQIIDVAGGRVITVIEMLSLSNKLPGEGMNLYRQKQSELAAGGVGLVEIDLLRAGNRVQMVKEQRLSPALRTPYRVCVRPGWEAREAGFIPIPLRERLPKFRVPLRKSDVPVKLDLQLLIDQAYENGRYDGIDYTSDPVPPLEDGDAAWAAQLLRAAGRR